MYIQPTLLPEAALPPEATLPPAQLNLYRQVVTETRPTRNIGEEIVFFATKPSTVSMRR